MFNKQDSQRTEPTPSTPVAESRNPSPVVQSSVNRILKGSRLSGNVQIDCDMELSGEVEGNITSETNSNIVIKGLCKGGIATKEGSVKVEGELRGGDIVAGQDVAITGKFAGGKVSALGKILVNGEFNGVLEAKEIEVGPSAKGAGRLLYRDSISVAKGAQLEGEIARVVQEKPAKQPTQKLASKASGKVAGAVAKPATEVRQKSLVDSSAKTGDKVAEKVVSMAGGESDRSKAAGSTT